MKAGVYYNNSDVRVEPRPQPAAGDDGFVIKVHACGICGSDLLEWYRIQRAPLVLGHEVAGEVTQVGDSVHGVHPGDRVFVTHHVPCDACYYCLTGHTTACRTFQKVNNFDPGGFSQYLRIGGRSVVTGTLTLPDTMSYETATFVEPLGTVVRGMRTVAHTPGEDILIIGSGIAGILFVKLARALGAGTVVVADVNEYRLDIATQAGADHAFLSDEHLGDRLRDTLGKAAEKVIICTGSHGGAHAALGCVEPGGVVLFFAVPKPGEQLGVDFNPFWRNDITFKTCYGAAPLDNMQSMRLLSRQVIDVSDMITHRFPLDAIGEAFRTATHPQGTLKVIVTPNE
jgi:L-iditol 2-dehydrogenase